jgi:rRNA-processing protein EBP2
LRPTTDAKLDDSVLIEEADPEAIRLDDLESNASVDEDAVPMRKVTANNKVRLLSLVYISKLIIQPAMRILIEGLKVSHLPWPETLVLQSKEKIDVDPQDGESFSLKIVQH